MPKASGLMNERERAICARIRLFREKIKWSRKAFAAELGITEARLVSIERGGTPLRLDLALTVCRAFDISPQWLATGIGLLGRYTFVTFTAQQRASFREPVLFSTIYDRAGGQFLPIKLPRLPKTFAQPFDPRAFIKERFDFWFDFTKFTDDAAEQFVRAVHQAASRYLRKLRHTGKAIRLRDPVPNPQSWAGQQKPLTHITTYRNSLLALAKGSQLASLLTRVRSQAAAKGRKTELAKFLSVPLPRVSEWLAGKFAPGAETALLMLYWVQEQERNQNKSPARATTQPGHKTRRKDSTK